MFSKKVALMSSSFITLGFNVSDRCIPGTMCDPTSVFKLIIMLVVRCRRLRAVRIMEQRYFEQRAMLGGMAPGAGLFDGYRKGESIADIRNT